MASPRSCLRALTLALFVTTTVCATPALSVRDAHAQAKTRSPVSALIKKGQDQFEELQYEESIQTLTAALLRSDASKAERIQVYQLLAYNYITMQRFEEADAAVRGVFVTDETFALPETESPRFREFFDKVRTDWEAEGKPGLTQAGATEKAADVRVVHAPKAQVEPGTAIKVEGTVEDAAASVHAVELHFRSGTKGKFAAKNLVFSMGSFRGQIPGSAVKPPLVEYYLLAKDKSGLPLASRGDADAPLRVTVPAEQDGSLFASPWFWIPVGVVVVGGAIATAVIVASSGSEDPSSPTATVRVNVGE
jgi:hypothetical protein